MTDLAIGWLVVPSVSVSAAVSVGSAFWTYYSTRGLRRLESRLRRGEETFRLAQSPRVAAAIELWSAFCQFEAAVERALYTRSFDLYEAPTPEEAHALVEDPANVRNRAEQLRAAVRALVPVLHKAELLLDAKSFAACSALFDAYDTTYGLTLLERDLGNEPPERQRERHAQTMRCRAEALAALKIMIGEETK